MSIEENVLREQNMLLREMRDALLRNGSSQPPGSFASPNQMPGPAVSSGAAYVQARSAIDQMAIGQWGQLGWASAYRSQVHSSLFNDAFGAAGLRRAPNSMTQLEYQHLSADMFGQRLAGLPGHIIAPSFMANSQAMGEDLFSYSMRFRRAGDANTGAFGAGMSYSAANQLGRDISVRAAGDLRLSSGDYSTILKGGLASGQFDYSQGGNDELTSKLRQLTTAVGDLTRVTRASVSDISSALGNLRQAGVVDIADQRRIVETIGASARVAGLTFGEVAPAAGAAIQAGLGLGIGAATSVGAYGLNIAGVREAARRGIISPVALAAAGGSGALAEALTTASQRVAGSDLGALSLLGGGRDFYGSALSAVGGLSDPMAALGLRYRKSEIMGGLSADGLDDLMMRGAAGTARMMGVSDLSSTAGINATAQYFESMGMSPQQAYAAAQARFSAGGQQAYAASRSAIFGDRLRQGYALNADRAWLDTSIGGRTQGALSEIRGGVAGLVGGAMDAVSMNQGGWFGMGGRFNNDAFMMSQGAMNDRLRVTDLMSGLNGAGAPEGTMVIAGGGRGAAWGATLGGAAGTAAGAALLPFGLLTAPIAGVAAGAAGMAFGGMFDTPMEIRGGASKAFRAMVDAQSNTGNSRGRELISGAFTDAGVRLTDDGDFQALISQTHGKLSGSDAMQHAERVARIAERHGLSHADVAGAARASGQRVELPDSYTNYGTTNDKEVNDLFNKILGEGIRDDVKADVNFASGEGRRVLLDAVSDYSRNGKFSAAMRGSLATAGITGADITALSKNIGSLSSSERSALLTGGEAVISRQASAQLTRVGSVAYDYLSDVISRAEAGHVGGTSSARRQLEGLKGNHRGLLAGLTGSGDLSAFVGLAGALNDPLLNQTLNIESGAALESQIRGGNFNKYAGIGLDQATLKEALGKGDGNSIRQLIAANLVANGATSTNPDRLAATAAENQRLAAQCLQTVATKLGLAKAEPAK